MRDASRHHKPLLGQELHRAAFQINEKSALNDVEEHDARDFVRVLRAIIQASRAQCRPEVLLDVSDRRTLNTLLSRADLSLGVQSGSRSPESFLLRQQFVPADNEGLKVLRTRLAISDEKELLARS